jgi:hypothetical protein
MDDKLATGFSINDAIPSFLLDQVRLVATDVQREVVKSSGHWLMEEAPETVTLATTAPVDG